MQLISPPPDESNPHSNFSPHFHGVSRHFTKTKFANYTKVGIALVVNLFSVLESNKLSRVDLSTSKMKSTRFWIRNVRIDFQTLFFDLVQNTSYVPAKPLQFM